MIKNFHNNLIGFVLADSLRRTGNKISVYSGHIKKKRGNLYLSPVPLFKALALPHRDRTSNAEAHADTYITNLVRLPKKAHEGL